MRVTTSHHVGLVLLAGALLVTTTVEARAPTRLRVVTFDSRLVALACYRSPPVREWMKALRADVDKAKAANDEKRVKELEAQGPSRQSLMHLQVFSDSSMSNVTAAIADRPPATAAATKKIMRA